MAWSSLFLSKISNLTLKGKVIYGLRSSLAWSSLESLVQRVVVAYEDNSFTNNKKVKNDISVFRQEHQNIVKLIKIYIER